MRSLAVRVRNLVVPLVAIVAVWQLASSIAIVNPVLFPSPAKVLLAAIDMFRSGVLLKDLLVSLQRAAAGFVVGASLGVTLGLLTSRVRLFSIGLSPLFNLLRPIPAIALVPIAVVWFGIGEESKYFVIAYTVFLAVWLNTHHGMEHVPDTYIRAARSLGASRSLEFLQVVVPASAPHIFAGLRFGAALAFLSLVAAELTGASSGIGYRLDEARQYILVDRMFVGLIELGVLGATLDTLFVWLGRRLIHWEQA
ncbi:MULTISPECIES: ABC transporter permease [Bradyrhizobium]|jgi:NitT/TauT family transport system permease protein|uniref:ABC transporter permease n=3 Tax=Nitrobacteraceae TaxID=41294 RepID=UPI00039ABAD1|nr:ABC transporter permease [Bradyrhizobium denitrificans]MCL8483755.1 ABC transporter permease [Bradyrhizobium denitrificans]